MNGAQLRTRQKLLCTLNTRVERAKTLISNAFIAKRNLTKRRRSMVGGFDVNTSLLAPVKLGVMKRHLVTRQYDHRR